MVGVSFTAVLGCVQPMGCELDTLDRVLQGFRAQTHREGYLSSLSLNYMGYLLCFPRKKRCFV